MKYFAVLLFSLLAERSFANSNKCDRKLDTTALPQTYVGAAENVALPDGEHDDIIHEFRKLYIKGALTYGGTLLNRTYDWAVEMGEELINDGRNRSSELLECIESDKHGNETPTCLENSLENLTKQLQVFLELIPGNALIKRKPLPELRSPPAKVEPIRKPSPSDVFVNLAQTLNDDLENFDRLVAIVHLEGWRGVRENLNTAQAQFREKILNNRVLPEYRLFVDEVLQFGKWIERRVTLELWESFERACNHIIAISDDWKATNGANC